MAIPTAYAYISHSYSSSFGKSAVLPSTGSGTRIVVLSGTATNLPVTDWEWSVLSTYATSFGGYPSGSVVAVGVVNDFTDGLATTQVATCSLDVTGGYCFSFRAKNADGWSMPCMDTTSSQATAYILTNNGFKLPPENMYGYAQDLDYTLQQINSSIISSTFGNDITVTSFQNTNATSDVVLGAFSFDKADYSSATAFKLKATGYVTKNTLTGIVSIYNITDGGAALDTVSFTDVVTSEQISGLLTLPAGKKTYEIRVRVTGGGGYGSNDLIMCEWVGLQIR